MIVFNGDTVRIWDATNLAYEEFTVEDGVFEPFKWAYDNVNLAAGNNTLTFYNLDENEIIYVHRVVYRVISGSISRVYMTFTIDGTEYRHAPLNNPTNQAIYIIDDEIFIPPGGSLTLGINAATANDDIYIWIYGQRILLSVE